MSMAKVFASHPQGTTLICTILLEMAPLLCL